MKVFKGLAYQFIAILVATTIAIPPEMAHAGLFKKMRRELVKVQADKNERAYVAEDVEQAVVEDFSFAEESNKDAVQNNVKLEPLKLAEVKEPAAIVGDDDEEEYIVGPVDMTDEDREIVDAEAEDSTILPDENDPNYDQIVKGIGAVPGVDFKFTPTTTFSANDPKISANSWVLYLFPDKFKKVAEGKEKKIEKLAAEAGSSLEIKAQWDDLKANAEKRRAKKKRFTKWDEVKKVRKMMQVQDVLNQMYKSGPTLTALIEAGEYDRAFTFANSNGLLRVMVQATGMQLLGVSKMDDAKMKAFYQSVGRNYAAIKDMKNPYKPLEWKKAKGWDARAEKNMASKNYSGVPNIAKFCGKEPDKNFYEKVVEPYILPIVIGLVTWGVGAVLAPALSAATTLSLTASKMVVSTLASSVISAAQGANFGKALLMGVAGAVTAGALSGVSNTIAGGVSAGLTKAGVDGAANTLISSYVAGVTTGTISGAILNGGKLDTAFVGAAIGAATTLATNSITQKIETAITPLEEIKVTATRLRDPSDFQLTSVSRDDIANMNVGSINFSDVKPPLYDFGSDVPVKPAAVTASAAAGNARVEVINGVETIVVEGRGRQLAPASSGATGSGRLGLGNRSGASGSAVSSSGPNSESPGYTAAGQAAIEGVKNVGDHLATVGARQIGREVAGGLVTGGYDAVALGKGIANGDVVEIANAGVGLATNVADYRNTVAAGRTVVGAGRTLASAGRVVLGVAGVANPVGIWATVGSILGPIFLPKAAAAIDASSASAMERKNAYWCKQLNRCGI